MKRLQLVLALSIASVIVSQVNMAYAQRSRSSIRTMQRPSRAPYYPTRPALSPWFDLYRRDAGPLGNYNSIVRPELRLQDTLNRQQQSIQRQNEGLGRQDERLNWQRQRLQFQGVRIRVLEEATFGKSPVRPTGTGSTFMNYSHFYSRPGR